MFLYGVAYQRVVIDNVVMKKTYSVGDVIFANMEYIVDYPQTCIEQCLHGKVMNFMLLEKLVFDNPDDTCAVRTSIGLTEIAFDEIIHVINFESKK